MSDVSPWDKQFNESARAFDAFCHYRDLGPHRSIDKAYQSFRGQNHVATGGQNGGKTGAKQGRAPSHWETWSWAYNWVTRAESYDAFVQQQALADREKLLLAERQKREREHARAIVEHQKRSQKAASRIADVSNAFLLLILQRVKKLSPDDIPVDKIGPNLRAVAQSLTQALAQEAEALGIATLTEMLDLDENEGTSEDREEGAADAAPGAESEP